MTMAENKLADMSTEFAVKILKLTAAAKKTADCVSSLLFSVKSASGGRNPPLVDEIASR